jgi:hypothetical protein
LQVRQAAVLDLAGQVEVAGALGGFLLLARFVELSVENGNGVDGGFFVLPLSLEMAGFLLEIGEVPFQALRRWREASSFSRRRAICSISNCRMFRSSWSISAGIESNSIRSRDAASSIRSTALSGRKRSAM